MKSANWISAMGRSPLADAPIETPTIIDSVSGVSIKLVDVYAGTGGVVTGSARLSREAQERAAELAQQQELERKQRTLARLRAAFEAELTSLRAKFDAEQADLATGIDEDRTRVTRLNDDRQDIAASRRADSSADGSNAGTGKRARSGQTGKAKDR